MPRKLNFDVEEPMRAGFENKSSVTPITQYKYAILSPAFERNPDQSETVREKLAKKMTSIAALKLTPALFFFLLLSTSGISLSTFSKIRNLLFNDFLEL